jgi:putative transcriptional regulator
MTKKAYDKIMSGLKDAEAFLAGDREGAVVTTIPAVDVRAVRTKLGGSREAFSARFGLDHRAVQDWEQKRRTPDRSTRILMMVIEQNPKLVERVVAKARSAGLTVGNRPGQRIGTRAPVRSSRRERPRGSRGTASPN